MNNYDALVNAGLIPQNNTLTQADKDAINALSNAELNTIIGLRFRLGDPFLDRNIYNGARPNCFL